MPGEKLTFTKYWELALARLYETEQRDGVSRPLDVRELMAEFEGVVPDGWAWEAANEMVRQGLGEDFLSMQTAQTQLTAQGRMFVESERGTGIIGKYFSGLQIVVVTGDGNQVAVGHGQKVEQTVGSFSKEEVDELLDQAEERLAEDEALSDEERNDVLGDIAAMRAQVGKSKPNRDVLVALASTLGGIASLADIAEKLHAIF